MSNRSLWTEIRFMLILSFICGLLLGGTNLAIGNRGELSEKTISTLFNFSNIKFEPNTLYEQFESEFESVSKGRIKIWKNKKNFSIIACKATGSGMWGEITIVFVVNSTSQQLLGLKVIEQKETAGLGSKISEEDFQNQFVNKSIQNDIKVDAITGATTSSRSVEKLLNKALKKIKDIRS